MKPVAVPARLPGQASLRPDSATPRGIGRPPVRDHNMLMHGVRTRSPAPRHMPTCLSPAVGMQTVTGHLMEPRALDEPQAGPTEETR